MHSFFVRWGVCAALAIFAVVGQAQAAQHRSTTKKHVVSKVKLKASNRHAVGRVVPVAARAPVHKQQAVANGPLAVKSNAALVVDQETQEVLFRKNDQAVLPIASITKLMTGVLISEAKLPMDETITITQDDVDTEKGSSSRLAT